MFDLPKTIRIFIIVTVLYLIIAIMSVFIIDTSPSEEGIGTFHTYKKFSEDFVTDCNLQPKRCPDSRCDCTVMCENPAGRRVHINGHNHPLNVRFENRLPNGTYCYVPFGDECKEGYGVWVRGHFEHFSGNSGDIEDKRVKRSTRGVSSRWHCVPQYPGRYKTSGESVWATSDVNDEYGNKLKSIEFDNGLSFRVRDYCLGNLRNGRATGYVDGECVCDNGTEHFLSENKTSPCVISNIDITYSPQSRSDKYVFRIGCFDDNTYVKDLKRFLFKCPSSIPIDRNFVTSADHYISIHDSNS